MSTSGTLYIRNITEELQEVINKHMINKNINTKNGAVRNIIENYPLALQKIEKMKEEIRMLEREKMNLEIKLEQYSKLGEILNNLLNDGIK